MREISPERRAKFLRFREVYEFHRAKLIEQGAAGHVVASRPWDAALAEVPLTPEELKRYKMLVALHSVNGGELFGNEETAGWGPKWNLCDMLHREERC